MTARNPVAFMSYLRSVDKYDGGRLTELRKHLEGGVRLYTGKPFEIFQDRVDIVCGQQWRQRIIDSLNETMFLIPILTPGFFDSKLCREEVELFLQREKSLGRSDLILPIYYVEHEDFDDATRRAEDPLMVEIAKRQYEDWRDLRLESLTSATAAGKIEKLAIVLRDALKQRRPVPIPSEGNGTAAASIPDPRRAQGPKPTERAAEYATPPSGEERSSPAPKTEPPRLVVDQLHRGDHTTITEAIKAATPGTVILIEPGLYREGLVIDKPLEIVGQGKVDDVVIEVADKNVILFQTTMGRVANVTLRQLGGKFFGVDIAQGRLDLEDCDITSRGWACVAIHGGADPRLRRNRIHDGKEAGVDIYEEGRGTLEDNDIFANTRPGVEIREGGDPTLRRNRIHDGKSAGVFVHEEGRGTLENNDIFANARAGVQASSGGDPILRCNRIHDNEGGVAVTEEGRGTLEDNDIVANTYAGVFTISGGNPTVRRNRINGNSDEAIWVYKGGRGTFEDNNLKNNKRGAWDIDEDCQANLTRRNNLE